MPKIRRRSFFNQRFIALLLCVLVGLGLSLNFNGLARAEGSRDLYPNGATGSRANINWRTGIFGQLLLRRTLFKVYANAGEVILVASTAVDDISNVGGGTGVGDIRIYNPGGVTGPVGNESIPGTPDFSCVQQRQTINPNLGSIDSRAEELAGPDTITDPLTGAEGNPADNTYAPCFYTVPADGIYHVVFYGPEGDGSDVFSPPFPTGDIAMAAANNFNGNQLTSITAWDVTVRTNLNSSTDLTGRLFTDYLSMVTGNNSRPLDSTMFILTRDGYIYQTNLGGVDPNAFVFFANNVGFLDNGIPLYRDIVGTDDNLAGLPAGISLSPPDQLIFINNPASAAISANGINPPIAPVITSISFAGTLGGNNTLVGAGGTFTYDSNTNGIYELILSRDGVNFDPTLPTNRVLRGLGSAPTQNVTWDGLDNSGNPFPAGTNYPMRIILRAGEYHFPLLDAENSGGGPRYTLTNPPGGTCPTYDEGVTFSCTTAFYDDRGYVTSGGTAVGALNTILPGNNPPSVDRSDPLTGFDTSTSNQRTYGNGAGTGFGDKKGLDIWTYFPSAVRRASVNIFDTALTPTPTPIPTELPATATPTPLPPPTATEKPHSGNPQGPTATPPPPPPPPPGPPTATATPISIAVAPVPPATPVIPVTFLPETGLREIEGTFGWLGKSLVIGLPLMALTGLWLWQKRFKKGRSK